VRIERFSRAFFRARARGETPGRPNRTSRIVLSDPCRAAEQRSAAGGMLEGVCQDGERFGVGSFVFLQPPEELARPYVGSVEAFSKGEDGEPCIRVAWVYRPEDVIGGRRAFHGARELFLSDHRDVVGMATVLGRCQVHSLRAFLALPRPVETDFFSRFSYAAAKKTFEPKRVPCFCTCIMPFNPDLAMVGCRACGDWFHPACLAADEGDCGRALAAAQAAGKCGAELVEVLLAREEKADGKFACPACSAGAR